MILDSKTRSWSWVLSPKNSTFLKRQGSRTSSNSKKRKLGFVQFFVVNIFYYGDIIRGPHGKKLFAKNRNFPFLEFQGHNAVFRGSHHSKKCSTQKVEQNLAFKFRNWKGS